MHLRKRGKAATPYVVGGVKITLAIISQVAGIVQPPYVQPAVNAASQIIAAGVKANNDTNTPTDRMLMLMAVIGASMKGDEGDFDFATDLRVEGRIDNFLRLLQMVEDTWNVRRIVEHTHAHVIALQDFSHLKPSLSKGIQAAASRSEFDALSSSSVLPYQPPVLYGRKEKIEDIADRLND
ncbi:hypothetical protein FRB96_002627 [Tulasnella sp. 330]|nr:hypothetical protein FRB96_002627 [Tulasnella sp. 330]